MTESRPRMILVVEDNADMALTLMIALERASFHSKWVSSAADGVRVLRTVPIDLALVDWNLVGHTSADVIEEACSRPIPVLALSGLPEQITAWLPIASDIVRSRPFPILKKPVLRDDLIREVECLVPRVNARQ